MASQAATILHVDLDAFYASVEQLLDPSLRGRPIAVGGGVVLAASYEARVFGVRSGMPGHLARRLCPPLRFVPGHFSRYQAIADQVLEVCADFTPLIERISIDEAFLDVSGSTRLLGSASGIAASIRRRVRDEVGLPVSIGVARTKHLAKVASQVAKPDGLLLVEPDAELDFLAPLPVGLIWGVGPVTRTRLEGKGILTIGDLAAASPRHLEHLLGRAASDKLAGLARNRDPRSVQVDRRARSVSAQSALRTPRDDGAVLGRTVLHLADRVTSRLRSKGLAGRTVTVRVRFAGLVSVTRSATLAGPVSSAAMVAGTANELVSTALSDHPEEAEVTLLGVAASGLIPEAPLQLELPLESGRGRLRPGTAEAAARWELERAVDQIRARFGKAALDYASVRFSRSGMPDEFRELAEREL